MRRSPLAEARHVSASACVRVFLALLPGGAVSLFLADPPFRLPLHAGRESNPAPHNERKAMNTKNAPAIPNTKRPTASAPVHTFRLGRIVGTMLKNTHNCTHTKRSFRSEGSPAVVSGHSNTPTQALESVAFRHEKTAGDVSSGFNKMERAKRLELRPANSEEAEHSSVANFSKAIDSQLSTHASELAEISAIWPGLSREIRTAVLNLIRVSKRDAT
jgi:hypothetical protein